MNLDYFFYGIETQAYEYMGCHKLGTGVEFYLWAPHAFRIDLFMSREGFQKFYPMEKIDDRGIWHLYIPDCEYIYVYRYRVWSDEKTFTDKSDPYAFFSERRPANASIMYSGNYSFQDGEYMARRRFSYEDPLNIYEVHLNGFHHIYEFSSYRQLKDELIPYVKDMGYTHIEMMPLFEHPFDGSWGYQATGFFSPTSRYGTPDEFRELIDACHQNGIGVILDVSYLHFAIDGHGLGNFDGKACYEYPTEERRSSQWGSYSFDLSSGPVNSFLLSSAVYFLKEFHIDGLRMDAVSDLIYLNGRQELGENRDGLEFLKRFNCTIKSRYPDVLLIAENSTSYPNITKPVSEGGLGFDYTWDLGWMHDTLSYYSSSPEDRGLRHNQLTFSMAYFYSEKYILPFSHDGVVHMKKTIVEKMWGSYDERFSQCRNLYLYMFTHPGKKLNFLGNDLAMIREFDERQGLDWNLLKYPMHDSFHRFFRDLCQIYRTYKAFYSFDYERSFFRWIDADDYRQSIYIYTRCDEDHCFVIVLNMRPIAYTDYRIGVPFAGRYTELINSEKDIYSGCNMVNENELWTSSFRAHGLPQSIGIDLAPYAAAIFMTDIGRKAPVSEEPEQFRSAEYF